MYNDPKWATNERTIDKAINYLKRLRDLIRLLDSGTTYRWWKTKRPDVSPFRRQQPRAWAQTKTTYSQQPRVGMLRVACWNLKNSRLVSISCRDHNKLFFTKQREVVCFVVILWTWGCRIFVTDQNVAFSCRVSITPLTNVSNALILLRFSEK